MISCLKMGLTKLINHRYCKFILIIPLYAIIIFILWRTFPEEYYVDWIYAFRPAVWEILSWRSPYNVQGVYNPPWTFIPLIPLAILPPKWGGIILSLISLFALLFIAIRLGANRYVALSFLLIPQIAFKTISNPNIDFLAAIGFILPPQIGLFFLAMKPQIGIAVAIFWFIESWRDGGWKQVVRIFSPISIALLISIIMYGPYFVNAVHLTDYETIWYSYPLWPYTIPVGLSLLFYAVQKREISYSIIGSPFVSPYVASYTYPFLLLGLVNTPIIYLAAYIGFWLIDIILRIS